MRLSDGRWLGLLVLLWGCGDSQPPAPRADAGEQSLDAGPESEDVARLPQDAGGSADAGDSSGPDACIAESEQCNGLDEDCDGELDEEAAGAGEPCELDGLVGELRCREGALNCRVHPPTGEPLCGELKGVLSPGSEPYVLACDVTVPVGESLVIEAGVRMELGVHVLGVRGSLDARGAELSLGAGALLEVHPGADARLEGGRISVLDPVAGATTISIRGASLSLVDLQLVEGAGQQVGLSAQDGARLDLEGLEIEGFWIGLQAGSAVTGSLENTHFSDCTTGIETGVGAELRILRSRFDGRSTHLRLDPSFFSTQSAATLEGNHYDPEGTALFLSGAASDQVELRPIDGIEQVGLLDVSVPVGGQLRLSGGLELAPLFGTLVVSGRLEAEGVSFAPAIDTLVRLEAGGELALEEVSVEVGTVAGAELLALVGGEASLERVTFSDPLGHGYCLVVLAGPARPRIVDSDFLDCWVGVRASGEVEVELLENRFEDNGTAVWLDGASRSVVADNTFNGPRVHLYLSPDYFRLAGGSPPGQLGDNAFDEAGMAAVVEGLLHRAARFRSVIGDSPLRYGTVIVQPEARLEVEPGLVLQQASPEATLVVEGEARLENAVFQGLTATALDWREGSTGAAVDTEFHYAPNSPLAAVRITDASPQLQRCDFVGPGSVGIGVAVAGTPESDLETRPEVRDCSFEDLLIGVQMTGDAEPVLEGNRFVNVETEVFP